MLRYLVRWNNLEAFYKKKADALSKAKSIEGEVIVLDTFIKCGTGLANKVIYYSRQGEGELLSNP